MSLFCSPVFIKRKNIKHSEAQKFSLRFFERLYKVAKEENLIVFIGSGVSKIGGSLLWKELAINLVGDLLRKRWLNKTDARILQKWSDTDPRKTISICFTKCDGAEKKNYLVDCIRKYCACTNIQKTKNIYNLLLNFEAKAYITTNIGKELRESLPSLSNVQIFNCTHKEHLQLIDQDPNIVQNGNIFYLHGSFETPEETIFCIDKYIEHYRNPSIIKLLNQIFLPHHTVLFIGYALSELEILEYLVRKSNIKLKMTPRNFVLVPVMREALARERLNSEYYHYFDLSVELYDVGRGRMSDYGKLEDVVKFIQQQLDPHKPKVLDIFNKIDEVLEGNVNN
jgi:hypothetical protein